MEQNIIRRRYKLLADFTAVHSFLTDVYLPIRIIRPSFSV